MRKSLGVIGLAVLASLSQSAAASDLVDVWRAAVQNDKEYAVGRAIQATAQPRRDQAAALWRPNVALTASVGAASNDTETRGARFSAPGLGESSGVGFSTSVSNGSSNRWAVSATQPLYNPARSAQQRQLNLSADAAELEWQIAGQSLMLRTAERYFDVALAEETVQVLRLQLDAVQAATTQAQDRFKLGSSPATDTHEARARLAGVRAQVLSAESALQIKRGLLSDSTGLPAVALAARLPAPASPEANAGPNTRPLESWLADARRGNPVIRGRLLAVEAARQEAAKFTRGASASVDLIAQAGHDRLGGSGDFGSASNTGSNRSIGIQLSLPLFTGGYRDAKAEEALRLTEKATSELEQTRQQVAQQVHAAWLGLSVGAQRAQSLDEALGASAARGAATRLGREVGQRTTLDVLNAANDFATARLTLTQARVGLVMDRLRLTALAGQLDESTLRSVNGELSAAERPTQRLPLTRE